MVDKDPSWQPQLLFEGTDKSLNGFLGPSPLIRLVKPVRICNSVKMGYLCLMGILGCTG
jgi:hypothetical protein